MEALGLRQNVASKSNAAFVPSMPISWELHEGSQQDREVLIVWGHGWGQDRNVFRPFLTSLPRPAHLMIDFPGFGQSPPPPETWGTAEYADACAALIKTEVPGHRIIVWLGHSFGGRIGIQLAARHPKLLNGLCLVAAAGLPRQRTQMEALRFRSRVAAYKIVKCLFSFFGKDTEPLRAQFGSSDYRAAGPVRSVLVRVVNEDLTDAARSIQCPTVLIYGADDTETPPEIGQRFVRLIHRAELTVLRGQDHYSLLDAGRHLVIRRLVDFTNSL